MPPDSSASQSTTLVIVAAKLFAAEHFPKDAILLLEVFDHVHLQSVDPTGEDRRYVLPLINHGRSLLSSH